MRAKRLQLGASPLSFPASHTPARTRRTSPGLREDFLIMLFLGLPADTGQHSITAKLVANMLTVAGASHVITMVIRLPD